MTTAGENTENQILYAARKVFIRKGFEAARMQEIADEAGINKALLHYYFRSKDKLFEAVFSEIASNLFPRMRQIVESETDVREKVTTVIKAYIGVLQANPFMPVFIINTLNSDPSRFIDHIRKAGIRPQFLQTQLDAEAKQGIIRPITVQHLIINIIAMCVFPFVIKPIIQNMFEMNEEQFQAYLDEREAEVTLAILKSISPIEL